MILILAAIFMATLGLVVVAYVVINRQDLASADLARSRLRPEEAGKAWTLLKDESVSDVPFLQRLMDGKTWSHALRVELAKAGMTMKPGAFLLIWVGVGLVGTLLATRLQNPLVTLAIGGFCWVVPFLWLRRKQKKRLTCSANSYPMPSTCS